MSARKMEPVIPPAVAIQNRLEERSRDVMQDAIEDMAELGFKVGGIVRNYRTNPCKQYKITSAEFRVYRWDVGKHYASISFQGLQLRRDGTYGIHQHWVGSLDDLQVVDTAS